MDFVTILLYLFAALFLVKTFGPLVQLIKLYKFTPPTNYRKYGSDSGAWAVVTGASDGIGKAFAEALAEKGFNIVLVARNQQKLDDVANGIQQKSKKQTKTFVIDFSTAKDAEYDQFATAISGLDLGVLVNNVGLSYEYPEYFLDVDLKRHQDLVNINSLAQVNVTYRLLRLMVGKGRGLVLNISSISGCTPTPLLSIYSASKSFLNTFSLALYSEYKSKGIHVECLAPAFVVSKLSKRRAASLTIPNPDTYVKQALATVGTMPMRAGYFVHDLMIFALSLVPFSFLLDRNKKMHVGIRSAALKKIEREKQAKQE